MPRRAFDDDSFLYGEILAQHASVAIAGDKAAKQFHRALANRDVIGQARASSWNVSASMPDKHSQC